jgi:uncharacterized membrane protein YjjP (DUF1212 family)
VLDSVTVAVVACWCSCTCGFSLTATINIYKETCSHCNVTVFLILRGGHFISFSAVKLSSGVYSNFEIMLVTSLTVCASVHEVTCRNDALLDEWIDLSTAHRNGYLTTDWQQCTQHTINPVFLHNVVKFLTVIVVLFAVLCWQARVRKCYEIH